MIVVTVTNAEEVLNSQAFQGAGAAANYVPGIGAKGIVEGYVASKLKDELANQGVQADISQVGDTPQENTLGKGTVFLAGIVAGAILGALLKGAK